MEMKATLLVLDDQAQYCRSLQRALRNKFELIVSTTVKEAKGQMVGKVDLVLSDIRLDEANPSDREGLDFIRWARDKNPTIPIIAMSAVDDQSLEHDAVAAGATRFLAKPIVVSELTKLLDALKQRNH
jgi:DNA-binding NtrC family response regulator